MVAFLYRMPAGIPGDINRMQACVVEAQIITPFGTTGAPTAYGVPMVVDATTGNVGNMRTMTASDTAPYGFLVRPYPTQAMTFAPALGVSTPPAQGPCDILVKGYMAVLLSGTTAAVKGGPVYIWTAASNTAGAHIQGGFEAASSSGNTVAVPNSYFMGPADSNAITEVAFHMA